MRTASSSSSSTSSDDKIQIEYYTDPNLLQNRPWVQRLVVLSAGVIFNLILAFILYFGQVTVGSGLPRPTFEPGAIVSMEPRADGASYGLLHQGDVIVGIDGTLVNNTC